MSLSLTPPPTYSAGPGANSGGPAYSSMYGWGVTRRPRREDFEAGKKGNDEWGRRMVLWICWNTQPQISVVHAMQRTAMDMYMKYTGTNAGRSRGAQNIDGAPFAQNYPYQNYIFGIIRNLCGQWAARPVDFRVEAQNSHVKSRKEKYLAAASLDRLNRALVGDTLAREIRAAGGNTLPDTEAMEAQGLEPEKAYKDEVADWATRALRDWVRRTRFHDWAIRQYKIFKITGMCAAMPRVNEATMEVELPELDPWDVVFDTNQRRDNFKDPKFGVFLEYRLVEDVLYQYPHLSEQELEDLGSGAPASWSFFGQSVWRTNGLRPMGGREVLVMTARFVVSEKMEVMPGEEEEYEATGGEGNPMVEPVKAKAEKKTHANGEKAWEVVLVGGTLVAKCEEMRFQPRSVETPFKANLCIQVAKIDQKLSVFAPPTLVRAATVHDYMSLILKKISEIVNDLGASVIEIDKSQVTPDAGETMAQALERITQGFTKDKVVIQDFSQTDELIAAGATRRRMIEVIPSATGEATERLMALFNMWQQVLNEMMSWSAQTGGYISPYQAKETAQMAIQQAGYGAMEEDRVFTIGLEDTLLNVLDLLKLVQVRKLKDLEKRRVPLGLDASDMQDYRIGDDAYVGLGATNYACTDLGLEIKLGEPSNEVRQKLEQASMLAIQGGQMDIGAYLRFIGESDTYEAINKMSDYLEAKAAEQRAMEMAQMEQNQQNMVLQAQQGDADRAVRMQNEQVKSATELAKEQIKIEGA